ncbi:MAG: 3-oxoacyl-ACP reductase family protein [Candidatus Thorarchaeota archaeon]
MKVALITGSSKGIGAAIAKYFCKKDIIPILNYNKSEKEVEQVLNDIKKNTPNSIKIKADVSNEQEVKEMVGIIKNKFRRLDFLVNNAAIIKDNLFMKMDLDDFKRVIDVNLIGAVICTKYCLPFIMESKGRILNIASISGQKGNIGQTNYAASKAGIIGFTTSLARELAKFGITVNAISPAMIKTSMFNDVPEKLMQKRIEACPLKRFGKPRDIAELAYFLLTNKGNFITGQVYNVNGGLLM